MADIARNFHVTTRPEVIRNFMLLKVGESCSELRRAESERILRAQPFLADASVLAFESEDGGVDLEVRTIDEASLVVGASVSTDAPFVSALRVGNSNVSGSAIYAAGDWHHADAYRDGFGLRVVDYQLGGRPYTMHAEARRAPLGSEWQLEAAHFFLTDLQRLAWRVRGGSGNGFVIFEPVPDERHGLELERRYFDVGGMFRVGPPGRLSLFGGSLTVDHELPSAAPVLVTDSGLAEDTSTVLRNRYTVHRTTRLNALWGYRNIGYVRVHGFDALTGVQDIPVGFQFGSQFGRSIRMFGATDDDVFMAADLYVGIANETRAFRMQLLGGGRHADDTGEWDGLLSSGRAAQYLRLGARNMGIASLEWSGGWRQRIPFRLTLNDPVGGIRGYRESTAIGGQRLVLRLEDRWVISSPFGIGDLGWALFSDAGRLWGGDVPYGASTPVRTSVGVSLLGAIPMRSGRLWRLDLAIPVNGDQARGIQVRLGNADHMTFFWREPADVERARERTVPSSIFSWP